MKGLLLKDLYMTKKYCRMVFVCAFIFLAVSMVGNNNVFFAFYPVLITSMIPVTLIAYDERSRWDIYCGALPYSRSQIVSSKYLIGLILLGTVWIFTVLSQSIAVIVSGGSLWRDSAGWLATLLAMGLLSESIIFPVIFKYGAEKGRIVYYLIIVVFFAAGGSLVVLNEENHIVWDGRLITGGLLAAAVLVFTISWKISIKIYEKKEL